MIGGRNDLVRKEVYPAFVDRYEERFDGAECHYLDPENL